MSDLVPEGWVDSQLGEYVTFSQGVQVGVDQQLKSKNEDFVRFIRIVDYTQNTDDIRYVHESNTTKGLVEIDDIVMVRYGATGFVGRGIQGAIANNMFSITPKITLRKDFLYQHLRAESTQDYISSLVASSTMPALNFTGVRTIPLQLPPLPEQQKIAAILSSVDEVIEKTQAQINKLKDLKTGMMQELLSPREGQAANINITQGESKNSLHHTEFKDSPLGRIPVGWDASPLHEYCERVCVGFVGTCEKFYCEDGIPMIRTGNLKNGNLDLSNVKYVTPEFHTKEKKSQLKVGDLLIARHGSHGAACLIPEGIKEANCLNVVIVKVNKRYYQPLFLKYVFNSDVMKNSFKSKSEGSTQQVISTTEIANAVFPRPSMMEQERITGILSSIDKKIELNEAKNTQNNSIKKALMQDLLTGKVRVTVPSHPCDNGISASLHVKEDAS